MCRRKVKKRILTVQLAEMVLGIVVSRPISKRLFALVTDGKQRRKLTPLKVIGDR